MMVKIKCPKCDIEGSFSLVNKNYEGPYKCWKCRQYFTIKLEDDELKSCEPITEEKFNRQQELEALRTKFKKQ